MKIPDYVNHPDQRIEIVLYATWRPTIADSPDHDHIGINVAYVTARCIAGVCHNPELQPRVDRDVDDLITLHHEWALCGKDPKAYARSQGVDNTDLVLSMVCRPDVYQAFIASDLVERAGLLVDLGAKARSDHAANH